VPFSSAPFDHPTITIFNGHPGNLVAITTTQPGLETNLAADDTIAGSSALAAAAPRL
jgi:Zn-dependent M28 family amino/carboxypeptidase